MKKALAILLAVAVLASLAACGKKEAPKEDINKKSEGVMTYAQYDAAKDDDAVVVEGYVQAKQSWWDNKAVLYLADGDGAYFVYNAEMTEDEYNKIAIGAKVKVTGFKTSWSGEVEIAEGAKVELEEGTYKAEPKDATALLGKEELIKSQNQLVTFKGMTVEAYDETGAAFVYKNPEEKSDDLYFKASLNGTTVEFCVEFYLTGKDTDVYKAVEGLKVGDKVDITCFLYWYNGANPHVTGVTAAK